jgi:hypothetical protein
VRAASEFQLPASGNQSNVFYLPLKRFNVSTDHAAIAPACNLGRMEPDGISDIEGKVARVATSKLGNERVSNLADEPHWCSSVFGCRNACGLAHRIDIVERSCRQPASIDSRITRLCVR